MLLRHHARRSLRHCGLALACALLFCVAASAAPGTRIGGHGQAYTLTKSDLAALHAVACAPYAVDIAQIDAARRWTYGAGDPPELEVQLRCSPHTTVNDLPAHYNVRCRRDDVPHAQSQPWQCKGWEAMLVPTAIGEISVEPGPYSHERATQAIRAALASTRFRHEVHAALPSGCRLASNWSGQAEELAELSCASGHRFLFSFWCPHEACPRLLTTTVP